MNKAQTQSTSLYLVDRLADFLNAVASGLQIYSTHSVCLDSPDGTPDVCMLLVAVPVGRGQEISQQLIQAIRDTMAENGFDIDLKPIN